MTTEDMADGIALLCDLSGTVKEVLRDELSLPGRKLIGKRLTAIVDDASVDKASAFIETILNQGAAFGWEMNIEIDGHIRAIFFAGGKAEERLLIVGAKSRSNVARFYEELMKINNEQMNELRAVMKDYQLQARAQAERDSHHYEELMQLNNELANLQRELAKKNAELERLNQQKNQFMGMAAHDLRTPLNVIFTYSQFLQMDLADKLDQDQQEFISSIEAQSRFMLSLINNMLDVYMIESGRLELDLEWTDLPPFVEHNISLNRILAEQKGIKLIFEIEDQFPRMLLDGHKIEQVLNNLISNALKFSHAGTTTTVHLSKEDDRAIISVSDQGVGIPEAELDKLFKAFGRTSVRSIGGERSTGLGLMICKNIVSGHKGELWVESMVGKGTTFFISLPILVKR